jgi:hypothetical protein
VLPCSYFARAFQRRILQNLAVEETYLNKLFKFFSQSKIWVYAFVHIEAYTLRENLLTLESQVKYKNKVLQHGLL